MFVAAVVLVMVVRAVILSGVIVALRVDVIGADRGVGAVVVVAAVADDTSGVALLLVVRLSMWPCVFVSPLLAWHWPHCCG